MPRAKPSPKLTKGIHARTQAARIDAGLTQQAVADTLRVRANTVARWEAVRIRFSVDRLVELADLYGVDFTALTLGLPCPL